MVFSKTDRFPKINFVVMLFSNIILDILPAFGEELLIIVLKFIFCSWFKYIQSIHGVFRFSHCTKAFFKIIFLLNHLLFHVVDLNFVSMPSRIHKTL